MLLIWLIIMPLFGGVLAWLAERAQGNASRQVALAVLCLDAALVATLWPAAGAADASAPWLLDLSLPWVPQLGIGIHLALDGLSLVLVSLTLFLGIVAVLCSWQEVKERVGFFHLNLLAIISGIIGVFLALDLFLFSFFWEVMLVPMYFLISIWGHANRRAAALKFFLFTQAGGLLMLLSILALYFIHGRTSGVYTFDALQLVGTPLSRSTSLWIMGGFLAAFLVKVPAVPFHTWLPDAHTEAPTAGSVILAGLLLKTGAYGILRFVLPLFPGAAAAASGLLTVAAVAGILYGAVLAFGQTDLKRLVAYTSVSHMGFVLLGISSSSMTALSGVVMQMVAHGISTGGLFLLVGMLQERMHSRDLGRMGGLWSSAPRMAGVGMVFALASLGLPGTANFVAEFLVLLGAFRTHAWPVAAAAGGLVLGALYSLWIVQRVFHGAQRAEGTVPDLSLRETVLASAMIALIILLGLFPGTVLTTTAPALQAIHDAASPTAAQPPEVGTP